jgi:tetratricopeptide (TPR) repeat protein
MNPETNSEMNIERAPEMTAEISANSQNPEALAARISSPGLARVPAKTQGSLLRMFADPHLLEKPERAELVQSLRECVRAHPDVADLRVLFGMALCVDFQVQDAIEELREGVRLAPDSFIAQLKMGELWMRLRVIEKAQEHTHQAALLARNMMQSELARKQGAALRALVQNGIKRDGPAYKGSWHVATIIRKLWKRDRTEVEALAAVDIP